MLDRETIERAKALSADAPLIVGLSGGGDSTALLHLLADELPPERLCALVVDHALRPGSRNDAERALSFASARGVDGEILTLTWTEGARRAQAAARTARYAALCEAARRRRARAIVVAHNEDDQAETVWMRAVKGSTWRGLAGMSPFAPAPVWPEGRGIVLARPLLRIGRTTLRAFLRARAADWIEDPANSNDAFERVRVRRRLATLAEAGLDPQRLTSLAARLRVHAAAVDEAAFKLTQQAACFADDAVILDRAAWRGEEDVRRRALSVLVTAVAGAAREPDGSALARLEARFAQTSFRGAALGGARLAVRADTVRIDRDPGAIMGRAGLPPLPTLELPVGVEAVWDGRLALCAAEPGWRVGADAKGAFAERGQTRAPLEAAPLRARWLVAERVRFLLGAYD